jgi:hypothetical protein
MRPTTTFAALLICAATLAPDAHAESVFAQAGTVKKTTPGCPSYQSLTNFLLAFSLGGEGPARRTFQQYNCIVLHGGDTVTIRQRQNDRVCVTRDDDSACYWVISDDLESHSVLRAPFHLEK